MFRLLVEREGKRQSGRRWGFKSNRPFCSASCAVMNGRQNQAPSSNERRRLLVTNEDDAMNPKGANGRSKVDSGRKACSLDDNYAGNGQFFARWDVA